MPFQSESQRRFMWAKHPTIAKKWSHEGKRKKKSSGKKYSSEHIALARRMMS